jgi:hypothetical protein
MEHTKSTRTPPVRHRGEEMTGEGMQDAHLGTSRER